MYFDYVNYKENHIEEFEDFDEEQKIIENNLKNFKINLYKYRGFSPVFLDKKIKKFD